MKNNNSAGLGFTVIANKLGYKNEDYKPAIDWLKSFDDGKYAYQDNVKGQGVLYYGARYFEKTVDEKIFVDNDFMADLTVINPGKVGKEYIKTVGHYHGYVPGTVVAYPEIYEAITDGFEYLLQSEPDKDGAVDVIWVVTSAGDKVVMPPNYGHVSMNVGNKPAIEMDIQKRDNPNQSDYTLFKEKVGGALIRTSDGLKENANYKIKSIKIVRPLEKPDWGIMKDKLLYNSFVESPEKFEWLLKPQNYKFDLDELFEDIEI
ncbi:MAG: glucose-6-phosphate isomerase family protein [bacterium]